jgi:hypothetical protein
MKKKYNDAELPIYEIVIDDDDNSGIRFVSIVGEPAIETMGMAFKKDHTPQLLELSAKQDKQIIVGPAMIPNKKILRKDDDGNKYMVVFTKDTIAQMVQKFNSVGTNRRINIDHTKQMVDAYIMENWIVEDPYYDKSRMYGFDVPVGTWMISVKVEDPEFWKDEVKANGKYGFSIEGMMSQKPMNMNNINDYIDGLTESEILNLFESIKMEFDEDKMIKFFTEKGRSKKGLKFAKDQLPGTIRVYQYTLKEGETDLVIDTTREFCKHMVTIDKYWTADDIDELSTQLGYSFWDYAGSYNCRHKMEVAFITEGSGSMATDADITTGVGYQDDAGLSK